MTTLIKLATALISTVFVLSSCASTANQKGRIIEYTSDANGFNTKTIFYEGKEEVVAFDAQFTKEHARKAIKHLREFTKKPITWLVITHPNPDKFNGASVFQKEGAKVIASELTAKSLEQVHQYKKYYFVEIAKMFTNKTYPKLPVIDQIFHGEMTLKLQTGESIYLKEYEQAGVSLNQTVANIPNVNALIVGDLIHHNAHAWLEGGILSGQATPTLSEWMDLLRKIKKDYANDTYIYGGRGDIAPLDIVVDQQIHYLKKADQLVSQYIENLESKVSELKTEKAGFHYNNLSKIFKKEFPNYKLNYMIQYGIYGLVYSKI